MVTRNHRNCLVLVPMMIKFIISLSVPVIHTISISASEESAAFSLTLPQAVKMALENNLSLKNSRYNVDISESSHRMTADRYGIKLNTSANHSQTRFADSTADDINTQSVNLDISKTISGSGGTIRFFSEMDHQHLSDPDVTVLNSFTDETGMPLEYHHSYGISLDQPLLNGAWNPVSSAELVQSGLIQENARYDYILEEQRLIRQVIEAFYQVLKAEKMMEVTESGMREAQAHLNSTKIKLEEGLVARIHVSQADLQAARQESTMISVKQRVEDTKDQLRLLLDIDGNKPLQLVADVQANPEEIDETIAVTEALQNRLELKKMQNECRSADLSVASAQNSRLPNLDLSLQAAVDHSQSRFSPFFRSQQPDYSMEVGFRYTFGDRSMKENQIQEMLHKKRLENQMENLRAQIEQDVKSTIRSYNALKRSIEVSERSVRVAEEGLDLANQSYSEGLIGNLDLLKAQDELLRARTDFFSELMDLESAKVAILVALGRTIDPERIALTQHP